MPGSAYEYIEEMYRPELKRAGTHFFCQGCLVHRPLDDRSPDERYCQQCCDFLLQEAATQPTRKAAWMLQTGGQGVPSDSHQTKAEVVSEIVDKEIIPASGAKGIMKQRGRPRKTGEVSRVTAWRRRKREKEIQGVIP